MCPADGRQGEVLGLVLNGALGDGKHDGSLSNGSTPAEDQASANPIEVSGISTAMSIAVWGIPLVCCTDERLGDVLGPRSH